MADRARDGREWNDCHRLDPYLDEAERCDRVALLQKGRLVGLERPAMLQDAVASRAISIETDQPRLAATLLRHHLLVRSAAAFDGELRVTTTVEGAAPAIEQSLQQSGMRITAVRALAPLLEGGFIDLTSVAHAA